MNTPLFPLCTAFDQHRRLASGPLDRVALAVKTAIEGGAAGPVLTYDDSTGRAIDIDIRGTGQDVVDRLQRSLPPANTNTDTDTAEPDAATAAGAEPRGRGRPKLGVIAREVTLLPRHWEWLGAQSGGASVALRKLVENARRDHRAADDGRRRRDAAYHFMSAMAGDLPGFEEATRALYAGDGGRLRVHIAGWPQDLRDHVIRLTDGDPARSATAT